MTARTATLFLPFAVSFLAPSLIAQDSELTGPVLGYVVDDARYLRPINGAPGAATIGARRLENVRDANEYATLLESGAAVRNGSPLPGAWSALFGMALLDESGRHALLLLDEPQTLAFPARALRLHANSTIVLALLDDDSLTAWTPTGHAAYRLPASSFWAFTLFPNSSRALAYDPSSNELFSVSENGTPAVIRKLPFDPAIYSLAVDTAGQTAILLDASARRLHLVPLNGAGEIRSFDAPAGAGALTPLRDNRGFLLSRDPAKPLWMVDPGAADPLLVIPALPAAVSQEVNR